MDDEHLDGDAPDAHVIADGQTAETFGLMAELKSPGAANQDCPSLQRNKLEELVVIHGDHVGIPAPHQAMKCQGKRHSV